MKRIFVPATIVIYNDNQACVNWLKCSTTKGLGDIRMKENRVRENIYKHFIQVCHVDGKINLADNLTKEMKDTAHFVKLRDLIMCPRFIS